MKRATVERTSYQPALLPDGTSHWSSVPPAAHPDPQHMRAALRSLRRQEDRILDRWYEHQFAPGRLERLALDYAQSFEPHDALEHVLRPMFRLLLAYLESGDD